MPTCLNITHMSWKDVMQLSDFSYPCSLILNVLENCTPALNLGGHGFDPQVGDWLS